MVRGKIIIVPDFMVVLSALEKTGRVSITELNNVVKLSYSYLHAIKTVCIEKGWISEVEEKPKKILSLTIEGVSIVSTINDLFIKMGVNNDNLEEFKIRKNIDRRIENNETKERKHLSSGVDQSIGRSTTGTTHVDDTPEV